MPPRQLLVCHRLVMRSPEKHHVQALHLHPDRGIGGLLEDSQTDLGAKVPWYAHPNEKGRDIQAEQVADTVEQVLNR